MLSLDQVAARHSRHTQQAARASVFHAPRRQAQKFCTPAIERGLRVCAKQQRRYARRRVSVLRSARGVREAEAEVLRCSYAFMQGIDPSTSSLSSSSPPASLPPFCGLGNVQDHLPPPLSTKRHRVTSSSVPEHLIIQNTIRMRPAQYAAFRLVVCSVCRAVCLWSLPLLYICHRIHDSPMKCHAARVHAT